MVELAAKRLIPYTAEVVLGSGQSASSQARLALVLVGASDPSAVATSEVSLPAGSTWQPGSNSVTFEAMDVGGVGTARVAVLPPAPGEGGAAPPEGADGPLALQQLKLSNHEGSAVGTFWRKPALPPLAAGGKSEELELQQDVTYQVRVCGRHWPSARRYA